MKGKMSEECEGSDTLEYENYEESDVRENKRRTFVVTSILSNSSSGEILFLRSSIFQQYVLNCFYVAQFLNLP